MPTRVCRDRFFVIATRICLAATIYVYVLGANSNAMMVVNAEQQAARSYNEYAGEYNLKEIWDDKGILLPLPRDGSFVLKLSPFDHAKQNNNEQQQQLLGLNIKVDNMMRSSVEFLDDNNNNDDNKNTIRIGPVMSTRMMARTKERQELESNLGQYLERMTTIELKPTGATADAEGLLIFTAASNAVASNNNNEGEVEAIASMAKVVCQVVEETQER